MAEVPEKQICVIDGDAAVRDSIATFGAEFDAGIRCFALAEDFFEALREVRPACVVCAAELPDTSGIEVFERLRQLDLAAVPFALVLDKADQKTLNKAKARGIVNVLRKPLLNRRLLAFFQQRVA